MVGGFRSEGIVGPRPNVELFMRRTKLRGVSKTRGLSFLKHSVLGLGLGWGYSKGRVRVSVNPKHHPDPAFY